MNTESMRNEMRCETKRKSARKSQPRVYGKTRGKKSARGCGKNRKRNAKMALRSEAARCGGRQPAGEEKIIKSYVQELMIYGLVSNRQTIEFLSTSSTCQQTFLSFFRRNICSRLRKRRKREEKQRPNALGGPANCTETPTNPTEHRLQLFIICISATRFSFSAD